MLNLRGVRVVFWHALIEPELVRNWLGEVPALTGWFALEELDG